MSPTAPGPLSFCEGGCTRAQKPSALLLRPEARVGAGVPDTVASRPSGGIGASPYVPLKDRLPNLRAGVTSAPRAPNGKPLLLANETRRHAA